VCKEYLIFTAKENEGQIQYPEGTCKRLKIINKYTYCWKQTGKSTKKYKTKQNKNPTQLDPNSSLM